jgi:surface antigen
MQQNNPNNKSFYKNQKKTDEDKNNLNKNTTMKINFNLKISNGKRWNKSPPSRRR